MSVDPFIEVEEQGGHSVKRACELLGVSRAAFYARRSGVPRPRAMRDAELAESFFAAIKGELLDKQSWPTRAAARSAIFEFIEGWYNLHRLHSRLGYRNPADFEAAAAA